MVKTFLILLLSLFTSVRAVGLTDITAESYIVLETNSSRILKQYDKDKVLLTASIAKIITTITAIEHGDLDSYVVVDSSAVNAYGSKIYLEVGDEIKLKDLLYGLMLRSGNDAAELIAKGVAGDIDSFMKLVNNMASKIGMKNSTFANPSGLDSDLNTFNYSTAYDMAILTQYALKNEVFKEVFGAKSYECRTKNEKFYKFLHKHKLVGYEYITGGKTGFTKLANRTLVTSASKDGLELVIVTFNSGDDFKEHKDIAYSVFNEMKQYTLVEKRAMYEYRKFFNGKVPVVKEDIIYPLFNDEKDINYEIKGNFKRVIIKIYLKDQLIIEKEIGFLND